MHLVLGTNNRKKLREMQLLLEPFGFELSVLSDYANAIVVEETGTTFVENARLKACEQARQLNRWVVGEDSGLSVAALDGRPGVYSARYAGAEGDDAANNAKLLDELKDVPLQQRSAYYTSHITLSDPDGNAVIDCEERCYGRIGTAPRGEAGFGYDPLFIIPEYDQTFAELGDAVKSVLSHRARAMRQFLTRLRALPLDAATR